MEFLNILKALLAGASLASFACVASLSAAPARAGRWTETLTPHFHLFHESPFAPPGLALKLESLHGRLRQELAPFAPWMAESRVKVYVYKSRESYLRGEFRPPKWSNGVADYRRRLVASHEHKDPAKLMEVLAHEMTHLLFEGYWAEQGAQPPVWLNEGLAMVEESDSSRQSQRSEWYQAMGGLTGQDVLPLARFLEVAPAKDLKGARSVTLWYVQAYSLVYFLSRRQSRMQFHNFCEALRAGEPMNKSLWRAYRYQGLTRLEEEWKRWLKLPEVRAHYRPLAERPEEAEDGAPAPRKDGSRALRTVGFGEFSFHGLIPDGEKE